MGCSEPTQAPSRCKGRRTSEDSAPLVWKTNRFRQSSGNFARAFAIGEIAASGVVIKMIPESLRSSASIRVTARRARVNCRAVRARGVDRHTTASMVYPLSARSRPRVCPTRPAPTITIRLREGLGSALVDFMNSFQVTSPLHASRPQQHGSCRFYHSRQELLSVPGVCFVVRRWFFERVWVESSAIKEQSPLFGRRLVRRWE
jgi:hypothetical protein